MPIIFGAELLNDDRGSRKISCIFQKKTCFPQGEYSSNWKKRDNINRKSGSSSFPNPGKISGSTENIKWWQTTIS